ncbi:unnamed protein product [Echinostoma caproni]|uniref:Secreted protein n=1 Tax=Echinostoma caproni TaxID=27848 RepID=A0A183BEC4_9TREM|nr:unnamed protein product [Echinostoma caproni]
MVGRCSPGLGYALCSSSTGFCSGTVRSRLSVHRPTCYFQSNKSRLRRPIPRLPHLTGDRMWHRCNQWLSPGVRTDSVLAFANPNSWRGWIQFRGYSSSVDAIDCIRCGTGGKCSVGMK